MLDDARGGGGGEEDGLRAAAWSRDDDVRRSEAAQGHHVDTTTHDRDERHVDKQQEPGGVQTLVGVTTHRPAHTVEARHTIDVCVTVHNYTCRLNCTISSVVF